MSNPVKKILGISGSTRQFSLNAHILQYLQRNYKDIFEIEIFEGIAQMPFFNPDLDSDLSVPEPVKIFRKKISMADGIIVCTPEYVFSLPGALKNAIEWTVSTTVFSSKPVAFIVAAASGVKAMESLHTIFGTIEARINEKCSLLINGAKGKFDANGQPNSKEVEEKLGQLISNLDLQISEMV